MDELEWQDEPPTEPGWYPVKRKEDDKMQEVVWVRRGEPSLGDRGEELMVQTMGNSVTKSVHSFAGYEWAGPIPEPEEP